MNTLVIAAAAMAMLATLTLAQDPANEWLGYATATYPQGTKITRAEAKWQVPADPKVPGLFQSPWFGIESTDNLNLIQPVNPWDGARWYGMTEYFQWSPENNRDSQTIEARAGDTLHGTVVYDEATQSYTQTQNNLRTGQSTSMVVPIQKDSNGNYKNYDHLWVVYEKVPIVCGQLPASGKVLFFDIEIEFDGKLVTPEWTTAFVVDKCDNRAQLVNSTSVLLTWNP
ncbi:uncharacterized protein AMSG_01581 [Thecamonas trahens ATCC 50062]|uniref:Uncharacterized protein n=1 Tax=Thecamonas trahens ATCC 50062 TaxID=461836 RepID=A0A0L0DRT5_THETB|nr:hypothetical protein AMSG_01581 [Thecamonas trahens ATCC 50062]KNC54731.1 hypothetical protein AMSG_01581 [Thecamonas trahens ATCC 50062]|eukprot:XP_013761631.1 hypothetical protein AMSG_01581 [Thecamonas trahens ATCC 50062]